MPDKRREPLRQGERQQEQAERVAVAHRGPCQVCRQAIPRPTSGAIVTTAVMMPSRVSFATGSTSPRAGCGQTVRRKPCVWLNLLDPDGLWALVAGLDIKGDARALAERAKAFPLDIGLVDEELLDVGEDFICGGRGRLHARGGSRDRYGHLIPGNEREAVVTLEQVTLRSE